MVWSSMEKSCAWTIIFEYHVTGDMYLAMMNKSVNVSTLKFW